jgi:hypothetical protein
MEATLSSKGQATIPKGRARALAPQTGRPVQVLLPPGWGDHPAEDSNLAIERDEMGILLTHRTPMGCGFWLRVSSFPMEGPRSTTNFSFDHRHLHHGARFDSQSWAVQYMSLRNKHNFDDL